jgi:hypothetical protein
MGWLTRSPWQVITTHEIEAAHAAMTNWSDEETDNPLLADDRNYYKVEKRTKDGSKVDRMLYAGKPRKGEKHFRGGREAPATDQADNSATESGCSNSGRSSRSSCAAASPSR